MAACSAHILVNQVLFFSVSNIPGILALTFAVSLQQKRIYFVDAQTAFLLFVEDSSQESPHFFSCYKFSFITHRSITSLSTLQHFTEPLLQPGQKDTITNSTIPQFPANLIICGYTHLFCTTKKPSPLLLQCILNPFQF
ncbi:hypothetical protein AMECASPLE_035617 [Ameca splendens]|uniref:Uncharacterized protein n=1 Tax=Ameca splendens TaxID=208324 RepID=A0ABV0XKF7_9TELE